MTDTLPEDELKPEDLERIKTEVEPLPLPQALLADSDDSKDENVNALISQLSIPQKIKLALYGNKAARGVLIKDRYRSIPLFVLQNPRLTESEVLEFAKSTALEQHVLRAIATEPSWIKNYPVKLAIVSNPKVPIDITMRFVPNLMNKDLSRLARSKSIPQAVSVQCRKYAEKKNR